MAHCVENGLSPAAPLPRIESQSQLTTVGVVDGQPAPMALGNPQLQHGQPADWVAELASAAAAVLEAAADAMLSFAAVS